MHDEHPPSEALPATAAVSDGTGRHARSGTAAWRLIAGGFVDQRELPSEDERRRAGAIDCAALGAASRGVPVAFVPLPPNPAASAAHALIQPDGLLVLCLDSGAAALAPVRAGRAYRGWPWCVCPEVHPGRMVAAARRIARRMSGLP